MPDSTRSALEEKLGCRLDGEHLSAALTHASAHASDNYERLEFLGDRVLGLVVAEILYREFPSENEGALARRHAALVQGPALAEIARRIDLGNALNLSGAERAAGGADNDNILSDTLEAIIGAVYLDAGFPQCAALIEKLWGDMVRTMTAPPQDAKTALQEWAQGRGLPLPAYELTGREGPDHAPLFTIQVTVKGYDPAEAAGPSRRTAEKEAARVLLERLTGGKSS